MDQNNADLEGFVDKLIAEKDLGELDSDVRAQLKEDIVERAEQRMNAAILANLPPEKLDEFEALLDKGTDEEIQEFCMANIPDMEQVVAAELLEFRNTYLNP